MLAGRLSGRSPPVSYVIAHLSALSDLVVARAEQGMLDRFRQTLGVSEDRARDLVAAVDEIVTPGASELSAAPS
jgi:hypothetical protein